MKIEIVRKKAPVDETRYYFMVYVYDNKGELIHGKWLTTENLAGRYAFEMEQYRNQFSTLMKNDEDLM